MKNSLLLVLVIVFGNCAAQQVPAAAARLPRAASEAKAGSPPGSPQLAQPTSNQELATLLRAQTDAIKALSSKVDALEERIRTLEKERR